MFEGRKIAEVPCQVWNFQTGKDDFLIIYKYKYKLLYENVTYDRADFYVSSVMLPHIALNHKYQAWQIVIEKNSFTTSLIEEL